MERVSMSEFRKDAESIIRKARQGKKMILTYRGKAVIRLEPIEERGTQDDDPFYAIDQVADPDGESLANTEMDGIIYGQ